MTNKSPFYLTRSLSDWDNVQAKANGIRVKMKRFVDFFTTFLALIGMSPLLLVLSVLVKIWLGSPVFFRQVRPGQHGKPFVLYKFRTMTDERDTEENLLPDRDRLTPFGRLLRGTSLDELPELFNVLKGDMSLVGPRPLLMEYLDRYTPAQARRHEVRPGITGLAQIKGRQNIPFSKRLEYDVWYVDNRSMLIDLKILLLTVIRVFKRDGVRPGQDVGEVDDIGLSSPEDVGRKIERNQADGSCN
jgi:sugar transferase EpsL